MTLPSPATVLAAAALFVALGGPAEAARTLGLKNNSVTSKKIRDRTIATADLSGTTIRRLMITPAASVNGASVADGSLGGADLALGSVGGDRLAPASVAGDRLTTNAVGSAQIVDQTVGGSDIGPSAISGDEVANGSLSANDVGRFTGRLNALDFGTLDKGSCKTVASTALTPLTSNQDLRDDAIVVTPVSSFPSAGMAVTAQAASANQIEVTICNVAGPATANLGQRSFSYVSFDTTL